MFHENVLNPFLKIVESFGAENAFCINEKYYTYYDFAQNISKIRNALQTSKIGSYNLGLVVNDDIETYASIFAVWLEGLAYVPLHPNQPIERSLEIISQAGIELVINSLSNNLFPAVNAIVSSGLKFEKIDLLPKFTSDDKLAYILFTSGSTGKPKGVPILRSNVGAFMRSFFQVGFEVSHTDRCLQCFDLTFDVSVQSFLVPLTKGACTYTIPHNQIKYSYVYGLLDDHHLTFCVMAPSMLRYLRPYFDEIYLPAMKYCIVTAEASPVNLLQEWSKCIPHAEIFDFYGPTETTIYCTYYKFEPDGTNKQLNGMLSIGKAMNGITTIIIDEDGEILGANQKGELCVSGVQLTPGYWKNEERNGTSFFEKEINGVSSRYYKTGDLCYYDDDGDILYSGRMDYQVKIQGYRIELGEIEHHARGIVNGLNVVAISFDNNSGNTEIALFVEGVLTDTSNLLEKMKLKMPNYMIPTKIIGIKEFPLNSNSKIDRNELKKQLSI